MRTLEGKITLLINEKRTTIEIYDELSGTRIVQVNLTPEQISSAMGRVAYTPCTIEVPKNEFLARIGKKQETDSFTFEAPADLITKRNLDRNRVDETLQSIGQKLIDKENEGWIVSGYFDSRGQIQSQGEGKPYKVVATIRRWI